MGSEFRQSVVRSFILLAAALVALLGFSINAEAGRNIRQDSLAGSIIKLAKGTEALLVVKSRPALYVINDKLKTIEVFHVITGKARGDKQKRGDLKTPEGTYFFVEPLDGKKLPARYGVLAVVTDYPNPIDLSAKKTGSGIWLHGTDDPPRLERPRDSKGCVVALNADVLKIASRIEIGRTPIVVVEELKTGSLKKAARIEKEILKYLVAKEFLKTGDESKVSIFSHSDGYVATIVRGKKTERFYIKENKSGWSLVGRKSLEAGSELQSLVETKLTNKKIKTRIDKERI